MGELSKKIGEHGERVVQNFLELIGWHDALDGESLPCHNQEAHKKRQASSRPRSTHGIDLFFSSKSNLQDFTLDNSIISVKYSKDPYPPNPTSLFKNHIKDLAQTVECFHTSELRSETHQQYEMSGIKKANEVGVLFWLNNNRNSDQDVVSKLSGIQLDKSLTFNTIYVVDNAKASFIYDSISSIKSNHPDFDYYFHYSFGSSNYLDNDIKKFGKILPVEYLTSSILPFRLINRYSGESIFCISCNESFSEESISRLISLAGDVSLNFTNKFHFIFPDFDELSHNSILKKAKRLTHSSERKIELKAYTLKNDFRGLINE